MAKYNADTTNTNTNTMTKADAILRKGDDLAYRQAEFSQRQQELYQRQNELIAQQAALAAKIDKLISSDAAKADLLSNEADKSVKKVVQENVYLAKQTGEMYAGVKKQFDSMRTELSYLSSQIENAYSRLSRDAATQNQQSDEALEKISGEIAARADGTDEKITSGFEGLDGKISSGLDDINGKLTSGADDIYSRLSTEFSYVSAQITSVFERLEKRLEEGLSVEAVAKAVADEMEARAAAAAEEDDAEYEVASDEGEEYIIEDAADEEQLAIEDEYFNYDEIAVRVVDALSKSDVFSTEAIAEKVTSMIEVPTIDYDELARKVTDAIPPHEELSADYIASSVAEQIILPQDGSFEMNYELLADRIAEKLGDVTEGEDIENAAAEEEIIEETPFEVDYDLIADKVAERLVALQPAEDVEEEEEVIEAAEAAPVPATVEVDYELIADKVAEKLAAMQPEEVEEVAEAEPVPATVEVDYELIADKVAEKLAAMQPEAVEAEPAMDAEAMADDIARRVGELTETEFDIVVDEAGCNTLAAAVIDRIDYQLLADKINERIVVPAAAPAPAAEAMPVINNDELAEIIADKVADAVIGTIQIPVPEIDEDGIADKIANIVIPAIPANDVQPAAEVQIDYDIICGKVAAAITESQQEEDYNIMLDEEGIRVLSESIAAEVVKITAAPLDEVNAKLDDVSGAQAQNGGRLEDVAIKEEACGQDVAEVKRDVKDIKNMLLAGAVYKASDELAAAEAEAVEEPEAEEELVTVSDIVDEPAPEEQAEEAQEDEAIADIMEVVDEHPAEGEVVPDGIEGISGGVDFANMMKYNRSFIARIIQSSDDVKNYYGQVKNAMLAYKKVNSSIAWGAERFNKGRETIAKFKIRGKTLCLYLNLDPNEYSVSVYHHVDVSDNKSMSGTPMMVKIKSPRGVKKAIRLIDEMLAKRNGEKRVIQERDYAAMYPYETMEELIEDGLVKDVSKNK